MKVRDIMSTELYYVSPERKLDRVEDVMEWHDIRHVLVVDKHNYLLGLVSQRDLMQTAFTSVSVDEQRELLQSIPVTDVMRCRLITTTPDTDLTEAAWTLIENKIGCLPVLDDEQKVIGIVTESDFVKLAAKVN